MAREVYQPWVSRAVQRVEYGTWMLPFIVSISWRALTWCIQSAGDSISHTERLVVQPALERWRSYLLGAIDNVDPFEQHAMLFDLVEATSGIAGLPPNLNRFLTRGTHINIAILEPHPAFIYVKMGKLQSIGFFGHPISRHFGSTRLDARSGTLGGDVTLPDVFWEYLLERAAVERARYRTISGRQRSTMLRSMRSNLDRSAASETMEALSRDVEMFGREAFERED